MLGLYVTICIVFMIIGFLWSKKKVANPLTIFNAIWLIIVLMYQLGLSRLQSPISDETFSVLCTNVVVFSISFLVMSFIYRVFVHAHGNAKSVSTENEKKKDISIPTKLIEKMFLCWGIVEIVEIIFSGGIPVFWKIFGNEKTYMAFGIPTLHGLMNALGLVIITAAFYEYLKEKRKKQKRILLTIILVMLAYYLLLITRQVIVSAIIQMIVVYFIVCIKKITGKGIIKTAIYLILGIIAFGLIGTFRTGYEAFLNVSALESKLPSFLVGFYWVYMYLTMTIANINNAVALGVTGFGGLGGAVGYFLPSVIKSQIVDTIEMPSYLVTNAYNVSGYFISFYTSIGIEGVALIAAVYGVLGAIIYEGFRRSRTERNVLLYAIYIQIIALSFFANHLLYLPSGFQLIIVMVLFYYLGRYSNKRIGTNKSKELA